MALFRNHSYRSEAQLRACLLDQRSDELINQARHTIVTIENRGDFRIIRVRRHGEFTLRPGEILHLLQCLGRPAG